MSNLIIKLFIFLIMFDGITNQSLINNRKQSLIDSRNQAYQDEMNQAQTQEDLYNQQINTSRDRTKNTFNQTKQDAEEAFAQTQRQARTNYGDLIVQSRRQARALGGANSTGVMELYNRLDRDLQNNLLGARGNELTSGPSNPTDIPRVSCLLALNTIFDSPNSVWY